MTGAHKYGATNANGHRRRQLIARVKARDTHCAICGGLLVPDAPHLDPRSTVIDEDIPRARGGSPLDPSNCNATHRACNQWKSTLTLAEAHKLLQLGATVGQKLTRQQRRQLLRQGKPTTKWQPAATRWK